MADYNDPENTIVMDTSKAKTHLGWTPKYTAAHTLSALAESI